MVEVIDEPFSLLPCFLSKDLFSLQGSRPHIGGWAIERAAALRAGTTFLGRQIFGADFAGTKMPSSSAVALVLNGTTGLSGGCEGSAER